MRRIALSSVACLVLLGLLAPGVVAEPPAAEPRIHHLALHEAESPRITVPEKTLHPVAFGKRGRRKGWVVRTAARPGLPAEVILPGSELSIRTSSPSPAVGDGRVYVGAGFHGWALCAFHARSGKHLWTASLNDNGPTTVAVTPGRVVVNTESCTTYGITPATGHIDWANEVGPHVSAAPTVVRDRVYTAHHTERGCALTAMALDDGETIWQRGLRRDAIGGPVHRGGRLFLATEDETLHCFNLLGRKVWERKRAATSAPWADAGALYVAEGRPTRRGTGAVVRLDPATGEAVWHTELEARPDPPDETVTTPFPEAARRVPDLPFGWAVDPPRPVVVDGRCVFASGRDLTVLDAETGRILRVLQLPRGRVFHAPPAVLGSRLLYATLEGMLLELDPRTGHVERAVDLGRRVDTQPVVDRGRAYVMSADFLFSIPWGDKDGPSWPQWSGTAERSGGVQVPPR